MRFRSGEHTLPACNRRQLADDNQLRVARVSRAGLRVPRKRTFDWFRFNGLTNHAVETHSVTKVRQTAVFAAAVVPRETADESIRREMPLKIRLTPTRVPIAQAELKNHCAQIRIPSRSVMIPSSKTQPALTRRRMLK